MAEVQNTRRIKQMASPYNMNTYVEGAKSALNYRGFDDYMVYYTLLAMGIDKTYIDHIGKDERNKRTNKTELK